MYLMKLLRTQKLCKIAHFVGIDEAGRGPIAGPVAIGLVAVPSDFPLSFFEGIKDSKQLTAFDRERWALKAHTALDRGTLHYSVCFSSPAQIDRAGITVAIEDAIQKAVEAVEVKLSRTCVFLDGSLRGPEHAAFRKVSVRGDEHEPLISLASILAKVYRDHAMQKLAINYPLYGFERHKGYGTPEHYEAIKEHGLCFIHRKSFVKLTPTN